MAELETNGMVHLSSPYSVMESVQRVKSILQSKGLTVFAEIDHSGAATEVGLKMQPAWLIIFGSPKAGTPVMVAAPTLALDLPLKALAWEDAAEKVWLSCNTPEYLQQRHNIPQELVANLAGVRAILEAAVR